MCTLYLFKSIINHCSFYPNSKLLPYYLKLKDVILTIICINGLLKPKTALYILKHQIKLKLLRKCIYYSDVPQLTYIKIMKSAAALGNKNQPIVDIYIKGKEQHRWCDANANYASFLMQLLIVYMACWEVSRAVR